MLAKVPFLTQYTGDTQRSDHIASRFCRAISDVEIPELLRSDFELGAVIGREKFMYRDNDFWRPISKLYAQQQRLTSLSSPVSDWESEDWSLASFFLCGTASLDLRNNRIFPEYMPKTNYNPGECVRTDQTGAAEIRVKDYFASNTCLVGGILHFRSEPPSLCCWKSDRHPRNWILTPDFGTPVLRRPTGHYKFQVPLDDDYLAEELGIQTRILPDDSSAKYIIRNAHLYKQMDIERLHARDVLDLAKRIKGIISVKSLYFERSIATAMQKLAKALKESLSVPVCDYNADTLRTAHDLSVQAVDNGLDQAVSQADIAFMIKVLNRWSDRSVELSISNNALRPIRAAID